MPDAKRTDTCFLRDLIREIPDFPDPGIAFKDITPLLGHDDCFRYAVDALADHFAGRDVDAIAAIDARGFLFAAPVAYRLGVGLVPVRKPGKLPAKILQHTYDLEYGSNTLEIHADALTSGARTVIVDDVLATGGTAAAAKTLVEHAGGVAIGFGFVCELDFLGGRNKLGTVPVHSLVNYS
jgi:adenine phosphoribosyltransferase